MAQFLSLILSRIRQPRVIAEVIGGVILGPTVMGRIPGFRNAIFPNEGMASLTLTSTIGLVLFLFLVGLEIDTRLLKRNAFASSTVSIAGLVIPLGLGAALGVAVYNQYVGPNAGINFGHFLLFIAVAVGITAFPVLCRILTELKLLDTEVGLVTLSAGIGNDVVGWILLALTVALVNASSGLTALWVLLSSAGYTVFLLLPVKWAYVWLAKRTGSLEKGGFLAGLIVPHDNGYSISIVEKIEDLVSLALLPIYFTLSGLKTDLGLLNTGTDWGYIVLICLVAFTSKFLSCGITAYFNGFNWREAGAIGSLMSCKGLVELIVLNIGLQANILSQKTFSMFVVHALVLTFMTTPLVILFYPPKYRVHERAANTKAELENAVKPLDDLDDGKRTKFAIVLDKIEALPAAMNLTQLLQPSSSSPTFSSETSTINEKSVDAGFSSSTRRYSKAVKVDVLRLMELTNRSSAVLRSQHADALVYNDPVVSIYRTFGKIHNLKVSANLSVVNFNEFPETISRHVEDSGSQMVIIPWPRGVTSVLDEKQDDDISIRNPFDGVFHRNITTQDQTSSIIYSEYIRSVFAQTATDIALFVDRGSNADSTSNQHLFLAFFGGPDDRLALSFLVQLCGRTTTTATVVKMEKTEAHSGQTTNSRTGAGASAFHHNTVVAADTVYGQPNTETRLSSDTADNLLWGYYTNPNKTHSPDVAAALSRITFRSESSPTPLRRVIQLVKEESAACTSELMDPKSLIVLAGRSRRLAVESLSSELAALVLESGASAVSSSVPKTLGDVSAALVMTGVTASILVMQASTVNGN
ncbi:K(+)/H(+) antiporter 1 [Psilocybe cubensis]|uniref:K(+)/H(+) antiporter 1 n=1 Tax=Psilocybe cubensis TaxID=181762 RepID=A0ACB8GR20_PSICU|nr:K(+)/H(+) antiporter 1 [Psilocybe cubensis]KAH9477822.1 K(+)/H(+) antiporter 1 [Psilocybe cubensis]